jgi:hypothetical protein
MVVNDILEVLKLIPILIHRRRQGRCGAERRGGWNLLAGSQPNEMKLFLKWKVYLFTSTSHETNAN